MRKKSGFSNANEPSLGVKTIPFYHILNESGNLKAMFKLIVLGTNLETILWYVTRHIIIVLLLIWKDYKVMVRVS